MNQPPKIFDRALIKQNLATHPVEELDFFTQLIIDDLQQRLATISRPFNKALILAPECTKIPPDFSSALGPINLMKLSTLMNEKDIGFADPENLSLPDRDYNLIISLFDLGITNDVPGFLKNIQNALAPDGLFMAAFIGGTSLSELRAAWLQADAEHLGGAVSRIAPFIDIKDAGSLLQRTGFALPVIDKETLNLRYASPMHLMAELKTLGASNPLADRHTKMVTKPHLAGAVEAYNLLARDGDGRVRATLEIIWMSGWGPDESQQKPLKPGSAKISLTQILGHKNNEKL